MGRSKDRGHAGCRAISKELRGNAGAIDLQVRLQRHKFIFLWSGKYDYRSPSLWDADRPKYAEQMVQLREWLDDAKVKGIKRTFFVFHYPVFCRAGLGPIPEPEKSHKVIAAYAKDLELVVFNGHVHTTELYDVDDVKYLMLGGGGAEQDYDPAGRTASRSPAGYPRTSTGKANLRERSTTTS